MSLQRRNRNRGKDGERRYAKLWSFLGGKRVGLHGDEDVQFDRLFSGETKVLSSFVGRKFMEQATRNNLRSNGMKTKKMPQVGVIITKSPNSKFITMMWTSDLIRLVKAYLRLKAENKRLKASMKAGVSK